MSAFEAEAALPCLHVYARTSQHSRHCDLKMHGTGPKHADASLNSPLPLLSKNATDSKMSQIRHCKAN